ncbi:unnamed protein product [Amoebophrya sp. A25]|nr:unnamed protein product [Amoebophrya sp. A25]|eukprot:GSA25T00003257001.1
MKDSTSPSGERPMNRSSTRKRRRTSSASDVPRRRASAELVEKEEQGMKNGDGDVPSTSNIMSMDVDEETNGGGNRTTDTRTHPGGGIHIDDPEGKRHTTRTITSTTRKSTLEKCLSLLPPELFVRDRRTYRHFVFGSFNNVAKIQDSVLDAWIQILERTGPDVRLAFKGRPFVAQPLGTIHPFEKRIPQHLWPRIDLWPSSPTTEEHQSCYRFIDLALDPFPYSGTTTTCEALLCGTPVLTWSEPKRTLHAQNVSSSLMRAFLRPGRCRKDLLLPRGLEELSTSGDCERSEDCVEYAEKIHQNQEELDEDPCYFSNPWVAFSREEYIERAIAFANNRIRFEKRGIQKAMLTSELCDAPTYMEEIEATFHALWNEEQAKYDGS